MNGAAAARLPDGRLHLQHGPIDLVIEAWGETREVEAAYVQAARRFDGVLGTLVAELDRLRVPVSATYPMLADAVARRMVRAVWPHRAVFVTPMAAVAGAVADEILAALVAGRVLERAYVNNGGDIALHLGHGHGFKAAVVGNQDMPAVDALSRIEYGDPVRGVATSGWRGRSQSLGIADAVTVLAADAAAADAAATLIANMVNADNPAIRRAPAGELRDDSDLGDRPVTVDVGPLPEREVESALASGACAAAAMRAQGLIAAALILLQGRQRVVGGSGAGAKPGVTGIEGTPGTGEPIPF